MRMCPRGGQIFLARVLSILKNIDDITKNKWYKFQRPVSNTSDFIQTYVATNTENHKLPKTEFKALFYFDKKKGDQKFSLLV